MNRRSFWQRVHETFADLVIESNGFILMPIGAALAGLAYLVLRVLE